MKHSSGKANVKLKSIGPDLLDQVDEKLRFGASSHDVADFIHGNGALADAKADSLRKMLDRYRTGELRDKTLQAITTAQRKDGAKTIVKRLHALDELEELCRIQNARLTKVIGPELKAPLLIKSVGDEISRMQSLLGDLARLQLETGMIQRQSKTVKGFMTDQNGEPHQFSWTEEFEQMSQDLQEMERRASHEAAPDAI